MRGSVIVLKYQFQSPCVSLIIKPWNQVGIKELTVPFRIEFNSFCRFKWTNEGVIYYSSSKYYTSSPLLTFNSCFLRTFMEDPSICPSIRTVKSGSAFVSKYDIGEIGFYILLSPFDTLLFVGFCWKWSFNGLFYFPKLLQNLTPCLST